MTSSIDHDRHRIEDPVYMVSCRDRLRADGALVLPSFFRADAVAEVVSAVAPLESKAFYAASTHNVYLTDPDPALGADHPFNRQVQSTKGIIADDAIPPESPLRSVYDDADFRAFLAGVLDTPEIHPYADDLSSINVHFASRGRELGWHFDNSAFAVTMLLQAPRGGGAFEFVPDVRDSTAGEQAFERVAAVLDGRERATTLEFDPGALVLFRGRDSLHRVTPTEGPVTRIMAVFAYNERPGVALSDSALRTFFGRTR